MAAAYGVFSSLHFSGRCRRARQRFPSSFPLLLHAFKFVIIFEQISFSFQSGGRKCLAKCMAKAKGTLPVTASPFLSLSLLLIYALFFMPQNGHYRCFCSVASLFSNDTGIFHFQDR